MSAKRISTMTAAVAAAALSLTACGEGNSTGTSAAASTDRATTSVATGATASGASSSDGTNSAAPGNVDVKVGDTIDAMELGKRTQAALQAAKTAHAEIADDSSGTMSMDIDMATMDFALSGDSGGENFEIRKVGERLFMGGMPDMPGGKKWLRAASRTS